MIIQLQELDGMEILSPNLLPEYDDFKTGVGKFLTNFFDDIRQEALEKVDYELPKGLHWFHNSYNRGL